MKMLGTFVAGRYTGTLNSVDIGLTQEGYRLRWSYVSDDVDATDGYGQGTLIERFYQGVNVWVSGIFKEWIQGVLSAVAPYQSYAPAGATSFNQGVVSRAASAVGTQLVLTATAGTPAAASPASLTAPIVIQDSGFNVEQLYGPTHRTTPFMFRVIPSSVGGATRYFSCT